MNDEDWAALTFNERQWVLAVLLLSIVAFFAIVFALARDHVSTAGAGRLLAFAALAPYAGFCRWMLRRARKR